MNSNVTATPVPGTLLSTASTSTAAALFSSRKIWVGIVTVFSIAGAVALRAFDKIPADALTPTISAISATALGLIGSIAWEDAAQKSAPIVTSNVMTSPPGSPSLPPANDVAAKAA